MNALSPKRLVRCLGALLLAACVVPTVFAVALERTSVTLKTALYGLAPGDVLIVRGVETRRDAPASQLSVVFLNERDEVVGRGTHTVRPGEPAAFRVGHDSLGLGGPFPAVRAELVLTRTGNLSAVIVNAEILNTNTLVARDAAPPCPTPYFGERIQFNCTCDGWGVGPTDEVPRGR